MSREGRDDEIEKDFEVTLKIERILARAYLFSIRRGRTSCKEIQDHLQISGEEADRVVAQLLEYGIVIKSAEEGLYKVLHPRMGLTNILNLLYPNPRDRPKETRLIVDRMAMKLTRIYEGV